MNAHSNTRGPWHVNAVSKGRIIGDETAQGAEKFLIASANATVATVYRARDARLVAEAPRMRAALEAILAKTAGSDPGTPGAEILVIATEALTRSTL